MATSCPAPDERARKFSGDNFHAVPDAALGRAMSSWTSMLLRCFSPAEKAYRNYGGRGITVCERWFLFANFLSDMGPRPEGRTLERLNNGGHYEPTNCAWATPGEQARNTRRNHRMTVNGESVVQAEAARRGGVSDATIMRRLARGHSAEEAISGALVRRVKLRPVDVEKIRCWLAEGYRDWQLAAHFRVSRQTIGQIRREVTWRT